MIRIIGRRTLQAAISLVGASLVVFLVVRSLPGDPTGHLLGPLASEAQKEALRASLGLDQPLVVQYGIWMSQVLSGDLGTSISQNRPVAALLGSALSVTVALTVYSIVVALIIGLILGNLSTRGPRAGRRVADVVEAVLLSAPQYTVALILLVALCVIIPVFPSGGVSLSAPLGEILHRLTLPAIALALPPGAMIGRALKTSLAGPEIGELSGALVARGIPRAGVLVHTHRNALPSIVTVIAIQVGTMLGGAVFVEAIFSLPGLGNLALQAIGPRDFPLLQGVILLIATMFIAVMAIGDVLVAAIDPRVRKGALR